jgi:hypothetical protein
MFIRAKGLAMRLGSGVDVVLEDEIGRKDSVKLVLKVLTKEDDHEFTVAEGLTAEQAETMIDGFYTALRNEEDNINFLTMSDTV